MPPSSAESAFVAATFFANARAGAALETEASRLAGQRSTNGEVKRLARMFADQGVATQRELARISRQPSQRDPTLDADSAAAVNELRSSSPSTFDAHYLDLMVGALQDRVDDFERYLQSGDDAAVRAWVQTQLPALREDLQEADALRQSVSVETAGVGLP